MDENKVLNIVKKYTMIIVTVLVTMFFAWQTQGKILLPQNISNLIAQNAYVFVLASGMLLCILTGGNIDLSVGSIVCFVGAVGATLMENKHMSPVAATIIMLLVGTAIGAWQAFWIAYIHIPPFITTLAGMLIFRGLSNVVLNGMTVSLTNETFVKIFGGGANCYIPDFIRIMIGAAPAADAAPALLLNYTCIAVGVLACIIYVFIQIKSRMNKIKMGYELEALPSVLVKTIVICVVIMAFTIKLAQYKGIPSALVWVMVVVLVYGYITSKTTTGRYFYAVGGNEKATKLSGIDTNKVYFIAYTNIGFLSALAGLLTIARMTSAQPTYGQNYEMDAIGSCFVGGASAYGGIGTIPGVIVGAILMGVINLGMSIMGVDANYQKVVKGLVLLVAVIFDVVTKKSDK